MYGKFFVVVHPIEVESIDRRIIPINHWILMIVEMTPKVTGAYWVAEEVLDSRRLEMDHVFCFFSLLGSWFEALSCVSPCLPRHHVCVSAMWQAGKPEASMMSQGSSFVVIVNKCLGDHERPHQRFHPLWCFSWTLSMDQLRLAARCHVWLESSCILDSRYLGYSGYCWVWAPLHSLRSWISPVIFGCSTICEGSFSIVMLVKQNGTASGNHQRMALNRKQTEELSCPRAVFFVNGSKQSFCV